MDATGYERDEIEPHMDIRQDLAIRSSRLPVIMDAAERHFGITIKLEDFINVRTVQEIADRIALVRERDGGRGPATSGASGPAPWLHPDPRMAVPCRRTPRRRFPSRTPAPC